MKAVVEKPASDPQSRKCEKNVSDEAQLPYGEVVNESKSKCISKTRYNVKKDTQLLS